MQHKVETMVKEDLACAVSERLNVTKEEAADRVEKLLDEFQQALLDGKSIKLSGFGNFELKNKTARIGRNPKTKKEVPIKARRVVTFHAGHKLKDLIYKSLDSDK